MVTASVIVVVVVGLKLAGSVVVTTPIMVLKQVQKWGYKHCIACVDSQLTYMCIFSLWQQAYIKGAKWYRGETAAGQWTPIKWLWTQWPEELSKQLVCKFSLYLL